LIDSDSALQAPTLANEVDELLDFDNNIGSGGYGGLEAIIEREDVLGANNTEEDLEDVSDGLTNGDGLVGKVLVSKERTSTNESTGTVPEVLIERTITVQEGEEDSMSPVVTGTINGKAVNSVNEGVVTSFGSEHGVDPGGPGISDGVDLVGCEVSLDFTHSGGALSEVSISGLGKAKFLSETSVSLDGINVKSDGSMSADGEKGDNDNEEFHLD